MVYFLSLGIIFTHGYELYLWNYYFNLHELYFNIGDYKVQYLGAWINLNLKDSKINIKVYVIWQGLCYFTKSTMDIIPFVQWFSHGLYQLISVPILWILAPKLCTYEQKGCNLTYMYFVFGHNLCNFVIYESPKTTYNTLQLTPEVVFYNSKTFGIHLL